MGWVPTSGARPSFMPLFTNVLEEEFCELRHLGILGSWHWAMYGGIMVVVERDNSPLP